MLQEWRTRRLIRALAGAKRYERAVVKLAAIGRPAVPDLVAALRHDDARVRAGALNALGAIDLDQPSAMIDVILPAKADGNDAVRQSADQALENIGVRATQRIVQSLERLRDSHLVQDSFKRDPELSKIISELSTLLKIDSMTPLCIRGLIDLIGRFYVPPPHCDLLARAFLTVGAPAVEPLMEKRGSIHGSDTTDFAWRSWVAEVLCQIGDRRAVPVWADEAAACGTWGHTKLEASVHAAIALAKLGDGRGTKALLMALTTDDRFIIASAMKALVELASPEVIQPLLTHIRTRGARRLPEHVSVLTEVLRRNAGTVAESDLRAVVALEDARREVASGPYDTANDFQPMLPERVDCSELRRTAQQELERRQQAAGERQTTASQGDASP